MHRLSLFVVILALVLTGPAGIAAQEATPETAESELAGLGYPELLVRVNGDAFEMPETTVAAGRTLVRLENVGETDLVNPWLANGQNSFRTLGEIVSSAIDPGMSDREKAFALWFQEIRHRYHAAGDNAELGDPVKVFNVYGHNTCGNDSICLVLLR